MDSNIVSIIKEIAEELDLDVNVVSLAVTSEFKFFSMKIKENLSTEENPELIMNYLGKFKVKKGRINAINKMRERQTNELLDEAKKEC